MVVLVGLPPYPDYKEVTCSWPGRVSVCPGPWPLALPQGQESSVRGAERCHEL